MSTLDSLGSIKQENVLMDLTTVMQKMLKLKAFTESITKAVDTMIQEMQSQLVTLRQLYEEKLKRMEESLKSCVDSCAEKYDRICRRNELVVEGVPVKPEENLADYFSSMCLSLGYTDANLPMADLYRVRPPSAGTKTPIVIEFALRSQRDAFFRRYLGTRKLSLNHLGFAAVTRIYVNKSLTPFTRRLLSDALALKRNGKLRSAYTRNGVIYVESYAGRFVINNNDDLYGAAESTC